jgi:hypothetical protein
LAAITILIQRADVSSLRVLSLDVRFRNGSGYLDLSRSYADEDLQERYRCKRASCKGDRAHTPLAWSHDRCGSYQRISFDIGVGLSPNGHPPCGTQVETTTNAGLTPPCWGASAALLPKADNGSTLGRRPRAGEDERRRFPALTQAQVKLIIASRVLCLYRMISQENLWPREGQ